jgi:hypothetical protein
LQLLVLNSRARTAAGSFLPRLIPNMPRLQKRAARGRPDKRFTFSSLRRLAPVCVQRCCTENSMPLFQKIVAA